MQIAIKIYDELYDIIKREKSEGKHLNIYERAIMDGTPLPKGHGRLIDVSDLTPDSDYEDGIFYAVSIGQINGAPIVLEASKDESID